MCVYYINEHNITPSADHITNRPEAGSRNGRRERPKNLVTRAEARGLEHMGH